MREYLKLTKQYVEKFKPEIEKKIKKTGINLEGIVVKDAILEDIYSRPKDDDASMYVYFPEPYIYVNEFNIAKKEHPESFIPMATIHEISHIIQDKIISKRKPALGRIIPPYKQWLLRRYNKTHSFSEGFAEYMSLDYLTDVYAGILEKVKQEELEPRKANLDTHEKNFTHDFSPYWMYRARGYKFFKKIINALGEEKLMEIASKPALHEIEIRIPLLYLMRNYPMKGIKNIPKFMYQSIKDGSKKLRGLKNEP